MWKQIERVKAKRNKIWKVVTCGVSSPLLASLHCIGWMDQSVDVHQSDYSALSPANNRKSRRQHFDTHRGTLDGRNRCFLSARGRRGPDSKSKWEFITPLWHSVNHTTLDLFVKPMLHSAFLSFNQKLILC